MTHCTPLECGSLGLWCAIDIAIRWIGRGGNGAPTGGLDGRRGCPLRVAILADGDMSRRT